MSVRHAATLSFAVPAEGLRARGALAFMAPLAVTALYDEVALFPKPGLVSFVDSGSHQDMDGKTFIRSLFALRHYFLQMATLGAQRCGFAALEACGLAAEQRMFAATKGVNTHRGAIFSLGLLCASAGALLGRKAVVNADALRHELLDTWGDALRARCAQKTGLPGGVAAHRHGLRSVSEEAALGFPVLFTTTFPTLIAWLDHGASKSTAHLQALMATMAVLDDCNLAHRGGLEGLAYARKAATDFLAVGGMAHPEATERLRSMHSGFVARRLSPGGSADMLAAASFIARLLCRAGRCP